MSITIEELGKTEISELLSRRVSIFTPEDTVSQVRGELLKTGRYEAIVSGGGKVGLVTIRDLLNVEQQEQTKVERLWKSMTPVTSDSWVQGVAAELVRINARALPVVENMKPVGIISQVDIVEALADCNSLKNVSVKDLAKMPLVALKVEEKVAEARKLMLDKGFSHVPITKDGKLVGIVTAQDIVQIFYVNIGRSRVGERAGEKITKYPGVVSGIMDKHPLTVSPDASALDVARGMRRHKKSACLVVDENDMVHGIITPRELLVLIAEPVKEEELPITIVGLSKEDFFERSVAEEKIRKVVKKGIRMHPDINEVNVKIKKTNEGGERTRYQMTARVIAPTEQFNTEAEGWDLLGTFEALLESLGRELVKAKHLPNKTQRRGRGRS